MSDSFFGKIKEFDWAELNGKELTIITATDSGTSIVAGLEKDSGMIYIIASRQEAN